MNRVASVAFATGCGVVAAALYLAVLLGTPGGLVLVYLTQLPLFGAGLWLGSTAAIVAGGAGSLVVLAARGFWEAALFAGMNAMPVALLVWLSLLAKRGDDRSVVWYPGGRLAAWLTGLALAGIAGALLLFGGAQGLQSAIRGLLADVLDHSAAAQMPHREAAAAAIAYLVPGIVAASWMVMTIANAALAQGVLARFGINWRPSPNLAGLTLPLWLPAALGLAAAATLLTGLPRFAGVNAMIALFVPFCLAGLAVLHTAARRLANPLMALVAFYTVAGLFGWPFLGLAIVGLLDPWLGLRHRLAPHGASIDG